LRETNVLACQVSRRSSYSISIYYPCRWCQALISYDRVLDIIWQM